MAKPKHLIVSELSNIEGRAVSWFANEKWKLEAFRAYDRGEGPDLYKVTAGQILGLSPEDVDGTQRNIFGKVPELACGFQGGIGAFQTFSRNYNVNMADYWDIIAESLAAHVPAAKAAHTQRGDQYDISRETFLASETVKLAWRARHPSTVKLWYALEQAARDAIREPGLKTRAGKLAFQCKTIGGLPYLLMYLPSGRAIHYLRPKLSSKDETICYYGAQKDGFGWGLQTTYGGKLLENAAQAISRDVLADAMPRAEAAGFAVVLTVHDELVAEGDTDRTAEELGSILATPPVWAKGFPLAADGFTCDRYRK